VCEQRYLVSVIIPTSGSRPALLKRAVESALAGHKADAVEVIVVPNGSNHNWRGAIDGLKPSRQVYVAPLDKANVSAARNYGLSIARGELVRFLDDDDYLIPDVAVKQCNE